MLWLPHLARSPVLGSQEALMCHLSVLVVIAHAAFGATTLVLMLLAAVRPSRQLAALRETY